MTQPSQVQIEALRVALTRWVPARDHAAAFADLVADLTAATQVGEPFTAEGYKALPEYDPETIERCAQVAEHDGSFKGQIIAAAIRALKDKPPTDPNLQYPGKDPDFVFPEE